MDEKQVNRRQFLKLSAVGAAALAATRLVHAGKGSAPPEEMPAEGPAPHWVMVIDLAKCTGCGECLRYCQARNDVAPEMSWNRISEGQVINGKPTPLPLQCMHCDHAPCVSVCPVRATTRRADGLVVMDYDRCIGCRYCEVACPYGARFFNWERYTAPNANVPEYGQPEVARRPRGVVEKCTFCIQRIDRGLAQGLKPGIDRQATPACVVYCPMGARLFGDLNDPNSGVSRALAQHPSFRLRESLGTGPRIYYLPPRDGAAAEESST